MNTRTWPSSNESTLSSARGSLSDHSNRYENPVQPPPRMPTRSPVGVCARCPAAFLISETAFSVTPIICFSIYPVGVLGGRLLVSLGLVVGVRALDRVLGQHRAVDLHRREVQLLDDLGVLDPHRLIEGHALDPLGRQRRRRDRRAAAEGLELGVLDDAVVADPELQL